MTWAAVPWMRRKIEETEERKNSQSEAHLIAAQEEATAAKIKAEKAGNGEEEEEEEAMEGKRMGKKSKSYYMEKAKAAVMHGVTFDIHEIIETDATVKEIHGVRVLA